MFDIRDHGGIYGAGKYRKGGKLYAQDTVEKVPFQILSSIHKQTSFLRGILGEDNTNYYFSAYSGSTYLLHMLNKSTNVETYSLQSFNSPVMAVGSANDGFVYCLVDTSVRKINVLTGELIWTVYLSYSSNSSDAIKIYVDSGYVYLMFRNSGFMTSTVKITTDGTIVYNTTISIISKWYYLEGTTLYSLSTDESIIYRHNITTGALIGQVSKTGNFSGNTMAIDYKNSISGIIYSYSNPNIIAKRHDGVQLWAYNISTAQPGKVIPMKDGLYVSEYSKNDIKLGLDGKVMYKNYQAYPSGLESGSLLHEYGKEHILGLMYSYNGSQGYYTPVRIQEYVTIQ